MAPGSQRSGPAGHFAGIQFDYGNIDSSRWTYRLPSPADTQLGCEMESLEHVLAAHALSVGVEVRRGHGVEGFEASNDEVAVRAGEERVRARWLVGCDGGRSTVRKQGGFEFVGTDPEFTGYSIQVEIADPSMLPMGRHYTPAGMYTQWQPGTIAMVDFDGGAFHRTQPVTCEHVQAVLRRVSCTDVTLTALNLASTWTDRSQQATTYRKGRVLLAGDAAHIHSPLGGQGLNLGLGDAMNLGWKLAATVRGDAPDGLLDSYTTERHPVGARILDWTRAQVALMRPSSRALGAIVRDLIDTRDGATYFAERVWGVSLRYDLGDTHPLVGRSCPDFELEDGTKVGARLREGRGLLLDFGRQASLKALDGLWGDRVTYVASDAKDRLGLSALLVRPDGFVAWASDTTPRPEDVIRAAARWFASLPGGHSPVMAP
jgi:2-polyprenyl-6-methoxyphenol hydroxylase-like FAD-dependent oxidoreductase